MLVFVCVQYYIIEKNDKKEANEGLHYLLSDELSDPVTPPSWYTRIVLFQSPHMSVRALKYINVFVLIPYLIVFQAAAFTHITPACLLYLWISNVLVCLPRLVSWYCDRNKEWWYSTQHIILEGIEVLIVLWMSMVFIGVMIRFCGGESYLSALCNQLNYVTTFKYVYYEWSHILRFIFWF